MDKKKVKELIEQIQKYCDQAYSPNWQPKSFEEFVKLGNICREAIKELSKSDWVSVEDGFPPIGETVRVRSKQYPNDFMLASRINKDTMKIVYPTNRYYSQDITHWKTIEKLEE